MNFLRGQIVIAVLLVARGLSFESANADTRVASEPGASQLEKRVAGLVVARNDAIRSAFGALFENATGDIRIEIASRSDPSYPTDSAVAYDAVRNTLVFRRSLPVPDLGPVLPRWLYTYWPYYENVNLRLYVPVIEVVDEALWNAHMLEAAERRGLPWPHVGCGSLDLAQRLGCEMLVSGVHETLRPPNTLVFNTNRLDRMWPESLRELRRRAWQRGDAEYRDIRRFGGISLLQPLVRDFGASRVFAYVAQTPFHIEEDNVRTSALRYQEQARNALAH